jgi:hypothetical protein
MSSLKDLVLQQKSLNVTENQNIINNIKNLGLTSTPISCYDLKFSLRMRGMLLKGVDSNWTGSLIRLYDLLNDQEKFKFNIWLSHITDPSSTIWDTTNPEYSSVFYSIYNKFKNNEIFNIGDMDSIYALGGGLLYENLSESQIEDVLEEEIIENNLVYDETKYEALLSVNFSHEGQSNVVLRKTPVYLNNGSFSHRGDSVNYIKGLSNPEKEQSLINSINDLISNYLKD